MSSAKTATLPLGLICGRPSFDAVPIRHGVPSASALSSSSFISGVILIMRGHLFVRRPMITFADGVRQSGADGPPVPLRSERAAKYEKRTRRDQRQAYGVVPRDRFL